METIAYWGVYTIKHVTETTGKALNKYENTSERLGSDVKALRPMGHNLFRVKDRLESIANNEEC
jgi:hypothetical protein